MIPSIALPLLVPAIAALAMLLAWRRPDVQRRVAAAAAGLHVLAGVLLLAGTSSGDVLVLHVGRWPAPFGITLACDLLSALCVLLAGLVGAATTVFALGSIDARREAHGYHPLVQALLLGVNGAFLTADLFNLYVWFEVMLMASFVLLVLGGERAQLEGGLKYVTLNLVGSGLFLTGAGLVYALEGTLNLAQLAVAVREPDATGLRGAVALLFVVAFGIKAAVFPLFGWLPASYHAPPTVVTALFSGLLTKVGVYALVRVETLLFLDDRAWLRQLLLAIAALTMIVGVLGAVAQSEMKRLLSFHVVSQIGYLLMGLGLFTAGSLAATIFFLLHVALAKVALFLFAGIVERLQGTTRLERLGGLWTTRPLLALAFLVPALSLAGLPPLTGFWAKLGLVREGLATGHGWVVASALGVSVLTLYSMMKIWNEAAWKDAPDEGLRPGLGGAALFAPTAALAAISIAGGVLAGSIWPLCDGAARQLLEPSAWIAAILGGR